jgi:hypothetical protein
MDLKTFVSTTLIEIVEGVDLAIKTITAKETNAKINPISPHLLHSGTKDVAFDVAVTVTDSSEGGGRAGIKVASFLEIGGEGKKTVTSEAVSRIQFVVPLAVSSTPALSSKATPRRPPQQPMLGRPRR